MQPRPDSIQLTLQSALDLKVALDVRIDPIDLALFIRDTGPKEPWANVHIDGKTIVGNTTLGVESTHTPIVNSTTWLNYVHNTVFQKETALSVRGKTTSYLGVLKSKVTMDKDIISPSKPIPVLMAIKDAQANVPFPQSSPEPIQRFQHFGQLPARPPEARRLKSDRQRLPSQPVRAYSGDRDDSPGRVQRGPARRQRHPRRSHAVPRPEQASPDGHT